MTQRAVTSSQQTGSAEHTKRVVELNTTDFEETVNGHHIVFVDFWAPWCSPCRSFAPIYEAVAKQHPEILFAKVNVDEEQGLAIEHGIRAIPTLMAFRDGVAVFSQAGALPTAQFQEVVTKVAAG